MEVVNIVPEYENDDERKAAVQNQYYDLQEILYNKKKMQKNSEQ